MKLTDLVKEYRNVVVNMIAKNLAESIADDSASDIAEYIFDLETGRTKPVCSWTDEELISDVVDGYPECFGCDTPLTTETAYVTDDDSRDVVCKTCHDA